MAIYHVRLYQLGHFSFFFRLFFWEREEERESKKEARVRAQRKWRKRWREWQREKCRIYCRWSVFVSSSTFICELGLRGSVSANMLTFAFYISEHFCFRCCDWTGKGSPNFQSPARNSFSGRKHSATHAYSPLRSVGVQAPVPSLVAQSGLRSILSTLCRWYVM